MIHFFRNRLLFRVFKISFLLVAVISLNMYARQGMMITGTVTDSNGPLPGVNISVKGTALGAASDVNGQYRITVPSADAVLVFSFMGYTTREIPVGDRREISIALEEDTRQIEEVVVVGYGTQKKVNLTGAVSAVKVDEKMASRSITNVSSSLSGLVPGLIVQQSTGFAGFDGASLQIRGLGTVNNSNPLIVVDGMPDVDINRINVSDIESISVLKDAASSAIYGSRAANGVILITTKTGKTNEKARINYTGSYAIAEMSNFYEYLADYSRAMTMQMRASASGNQTSGFREGSAEQWLAMSMVDPVLFPNTNQYDEMFQRGSVQNHTLSASGGTEKFNFYVSGGVMKQKGTQINNTHDRYNFRVNLDYKIRDNISVGARMDGQWSNSVYPRGAGLESAGLRYAVSGVLNVHPETGQYGGAMAYGENGSAGNMVAEYTVYHNNRNQQQYNGNIYGTWEIIKGLRARADYSLRYYNQFTNSFNDPTIQWNFQTGTQSRTMIAGNAGVSQEIRQGYKTLLQGQLSYDREIFPGHQLSVMGVVAEEYWFDRRLAGSRNDRLHPSLSELDAALQATQTSNSWSSTEGLLSWIGRLNYTMYDRYLLEANFRYDGSSKFSKGHQWGFFPSVALGWRISEEGFFEGLKSVVNQAKIRASVGSLGNNSLDQNSILNDRGEQQQVMTNTNYIMNGSLVKGFSNTKMINPELSWESTRAINIGLDLGFFKNKLTVELDLYDRLTTNMIRPSDFSTILSGYSAPRKNIGNMRNRGIELNLNWQSSISDFRYSINFNGYLNRNTLEEWNEFLGKGWVYLDMPYQFVYGYVTQDQLIQSWNEIYNAPLQGATYMAPGDILFMDLNGDGQVTGEDRKAETRNRYKASGSYGLTLMMQWKGFDLQTLIQASSGRWDYWRDVYNDMAIPADRMGFQTFHWNDTWTLDNRSASLPRIITGSGGRNGDESTFWLDNAGFIRMKNLQFGYNLPDRWVQKVRLDHFRIYFSTENLFTLSKWRGVDPDKYRDWDPYPLSKTFSIGLNIGL
ncbi:MAG: TonB-dependent receptor [Bacteroidales bacterium]|jgi:TonB-linked SusC/RagA family outer membrane protein|nr:TonB-dependent receptor [Bacteroidales bacterium]